MQESPLFIISNMGIAAASLIKMLWGSQDTTHVAPLIVLGLY